MDVGGSEVDEVLEFLEGSGLHGKEAKACGRISNCSLEGMMVQLTSVGLDIVALDGWRGEAVGAETAADVWGV